MKRDMDLIRELLFKLEAFPLLPGAGYIIMPDSAEVAVPGYDFDETYYHIDLIYQAGLIKDADRARPGRGFIFSGLTWKGHEFLDDIRDPEIWSKTKAHAKDIASIGVSFIWEIAKSEIKKKLGLS